MREKAKELQRQRMETAKRGGGRRRRRHRRQIEVVDAPDTVAALCDDARRALREFHPELNRSKREKLLATLATELYDRGLLLRGDLER